MRRFHSPRPAVYLDQWVWVRLAKANLSKPVQESDIGVLAAINDAAKAGVAFPLSATHYFETLKITDPRQRRDLASVMAPISRFVNLAPTSSLVRHQLRAAFHEIFGRPAFRPAAPQVLGRGAFWAMLGSEAPLQIIDDQGPITEAHRPGVSSQVRALNQLAETMLISGPADDEIAYLRTMGYQPEEADKSTQSRLAWEADFARKLKTAMPSRDELRVWLMARELTHEYLDAFNDLLAEYRINLPLTLGASLDATGSLREPMMKLSDLVPTMRVAADMKLEAFRNQQRQWTRNLMHDIDWLSHAVPYCRVVVPDRDAADLLRRSKADEVLGTQVVTQLSDLPAELDKLVPEVRTLEDRSGWLAVGPESPFCSSFEDVSRVTGVHLPGSRGGDLGQASAMPTTTRTSRQKGR